MKIAGYGQTFPLLRLALGSLTLCWVLWGCTAPPAPASSPASPSPDKPGPISATSEPSPEATPASDVAFDLTQLLPPVAGALLDNVVLTEWDFTTNRQMFEQTGQGIALVAENRNYSAVELRVKVIFYRNNQVSTEMPAGPYPLEARQTILAPISLDPQFQFDFYDVVITQVTPR